MKLATVELTRQEAQTLLAMVRMREAELDRMAQGLEEGLGEDTERNRALKMLRPQLELLSDLALKLEGAQRDAEKAS